MHQNLINESAEDFIRCITAKIEKTLFTSTLLKKNLSLASKVFDISLIMLMIAKYLSNFSYNNVIFFF